MRRKDQKPLFSDALAVYGGLGLLLVLGLCALLFRADFSSWERRELSQLPKAVSLSDWTFHDELEDELSDQLPQRQAFVGLYAELQALTGRAVQLEAWPQGEEFLEKPVTGSAAQTARRVSQFQALAGDIPLLFLTPPPHGLLLRNQMSFLRGPVFEEEASLYREVTRDSAFIPLLERFSASGERLYYRTDHHWTLAGAALAYEAYCEAAGLTPREMDAAFSIQHFEPFYGTTRARSGLPFARADKLDCAEPLTSVTLTVPAESLTSDHLIFPEAAQTYDGYAVYLSGNHGELTIASPGAETGKTLLVFKDSFANCFLPLLSPHYARIIAVDARYLEGTFRQVLESAGPVDQILCLYSLDSLLNDTAISRKLR